MSIRVSTLVWDHADVSGTDLLVLLVIADHAADDGSNAWPSVETIARKCRVSARTVQRSIRTLGEQRLIEVRRQGGGNSDTRSDRRPNRYRVAVENLGSGVTEVSPRLLDGVTRVTERGDTGGTDGVTPVSPKPSLTTQELTHARDENGGELWTDEEGRTWVR